MEKYVITISRQFASMGRSIARELAAQLQIEFLDRDIVEETAKRMNATIPEISREEEEIPSKFSYRMYPLGLGVPAVKDEIFRCQKSIMEDFVRKESCIIVGRCGGYCLKDEPHLLKVFVYAPQDVRLKNCIEYLRMPEKTALRTMVEVDKAREAYHKRYIPGYVNAALESDLCINSAAYSIQDAAELIVAAAERKFGFPIHV